MERSDDLLFLGADGVESDFSERGLRMRPLGLVGDGLGAEVESVDGVSEREVRKLACWVCGEELDAVR